MYTSILIPTDGSQDMSPVVDEAISLAALCEATVHALHVVDERAYLAVPEDARDTVRETLRADGESFTKSIADRAAEAGVDVVRELRWGDPAAAVLAYAVETDIDAIVMGTHGRTGYERFLLGSVAEKVVRASPIPVLTVAVGDTDARRAEIVDASIGERAADPPAEDERVSTIEGDPDEPARR